MQVSKHEQGKFCWAELATSDGPGAKKFYTDLFGWTAVDNPMGPDMVYTMLLLDGQAAAALYQDNTGNTPPHWGTYVCVDNVETSAAKAKELGGAVIAGPFDVMEHGRMAVVQDPTGAIIHLWQPKNHIGYTVINEPGAVCWNELYTRDTAAAGAFYSGLLGYGLKQSEMPMPYTELQLDGKSVGGMMAMGPEMEGVPPHWNIYFTVASCDETYARATALGASPLVPPMDIPGVGKMAMMRDPQGAVFAFVD
ncbi:MAG TPA: VOC family protein [Chthonomonadaceae bacterium]|nr:VOC family protein [Chthonomonadaceae bacterium]